MAEAAASLPAGFQTGLQQLMAQYNLTAGKVWSSVSIVMKIFHSPGGGKSGGSDYTVQVVIYRANHKTGLRYRGFD